MGEAEKNGSEEFADLIPVDPIEALETELRQARGPQRHGAAVPADGPDASRPAKMPGAPSRGAANFQAWCETRRQLDGADATFEVEFLGTDGERRVVDLLKLGFDDLPATIRAEFERRKFPDFTSLVPPATDAQMTPKDRLREEHDAEPSGAERGEHRWPAERRDRSATHTSQAPRADDDEAERPRAGPWPTAAGGGLGINFGGVMEGAGRTAASALAKLRKNIRTLADPKSDPVSQGVQRWRERRARTALDALETSMTRIAETLAAVRRHAPLKEAFRTWEALKTDEGRAKARARFREGLLAGAWGEEASTLVETLFADVAALGLQSEDALKRVNKAGQDIGPLRERLGAWIEALRERAGPLTNAAGESLGDTLKALGEAVRHVLERLAQRVAQFAAPRMT